MQINKFKRLLLKIEAHPKRFWFFNATFLLIFLLFNLFAPQLFPVILLMQMVIVVPIAWTLGPWLGVSMGIFLGLVSAFFVELPIEVVASFPNANVFAIASILPPAVVGALVGVTGNRVQQIRQLSQALLHERQQLQQERAQLQREVERRRQAEVQLKQAVTVAQETSKAKSAFLANMSHELRTPLAAVIGYNELLREQMEDEARLTIYLDKSLLSARHLQGIINDVLELTRIEAGRLVLTEEPFSLVDCLTTVLDIIILKAQKKGLYVRYHIHPHTPCQLIGDATYLQQILINLLNNSVKFTKQGGITLTIVTQRDNSGLYQYYFTVQDSGQGIAKEEQAHIFEAFRQVNKNQTAEKDGVGLGLAISKYLVEAMGGHIWVESQQGEGATFHFTIQASIPKENLSIHTNEMVTYQPNHHLTVIEQQMGEEENASSTHMLHSEDQ